MTFTQPNREIDEAHKVRSRNPYSIIDDKVWALANEKYGFNLKHHWTRIAKCQREIINGYRESLIDSLCIISNVGRKRNEKWDYEVRNKTTLEAKSEVEILEMYVAMFPEEFERNQ